MNNPLLSMFGQTSQSQSQPQVQNNQNNLNDIVNTIRNSSNPNEAMQNMLVNNPQLKGVLNYINQNGGDAKTAFYNMAAQMGVNPNSVLNHPIFSLFNQRK